MCLMLVATAREALLLRAHATANALGDPGNLLSSAQSLAELFLEKDAYEKPISGSPRCGST